MIVLVSNRRFRTIIFSGPEKAMSVSIQLEIVATLNQHADQIAAILFSLSNALRTMNFG
jgi:predicted ATPase